MRCRRCLGWKSSISTAFPCVGNHRPTTKTPSARSAWRWMMTTAVADTTFASGQASSSSPFCLPLSVSAGYTDSKPRPTLTKPHHPAANVLTPKNSVNHDNPSMLVPLHGNLRISSTLPVLAGSFLAPESSPASRFLFKQNYS